MTITREEAVRMARIARVLVDACLANHDVQELIADPALPYFTEQSFRVNPTVRVDYEEAVCFAGVGEGIAMTKNKHWGEGPNILPLEPDDPVDGLFIQYWYKPTSRYNRRYLQRHRLKEMLGRGFSKLVGKAQMKRWTQKVFLAQITEEDKAMIRQRIGVDPVMFWRACRGKVILNLPQKPLQTEFRFDLPIIGNR
jgi:hypothetical protein